MKAEFSSNGWGILKCSTDKMVVNLIYLNVHITLNILSELVPSSPTIKTVKEPQTTIFSLTF